MSLAPPSHQERESLQLFAPSFLSLRLQRETFAFHAGGAKGRESDCAGAAQCYSFVFVYRKMFSLRVNAVLKIIFPFMLGASVAAFVVYPSNVFSVAPKTKVIAIAEARRLSLGTVVTIEGSVTVPSGTFKASVDDEGFAVQDGSGGVYVSVAAKQSLRVGERVRVTGKLSEKRGLMVLLPESAKAIKVLGAGRQLKASALASGQINEATEGRLVKVRGMMTRAVVQDLPYGYRIFLDDGTGEVQIFVSASTRIETRSLQPGQRLSVTGFSGQYKEHYEVNPRFPEDIVLLRWRRRSAP